MFDDHQDRSDEDVAEQSAAGHLVAKGVLYVRYMQQVEALAYAFARKRDRWGRRDDAHEIALRAFDSATDSFDKRRGLFWPFARLRIDSRLRTWAKREDRLRGGKNVNDLTDPGDTVNVEETRDPDAEGTPLDESGRQAQAYLDASFEDPVVRTKWLVVRLLKAVRGVTVEQVARALAVPEAPESQRIRAVWAEVWSTWARFGLEIAPPPLPPTWDGCCVLFHETASASGLVAPRPPEADRLASPETHGDEVQRWTSRLRQFYYRACPSPWDKDEAPESAS